MLKKVGIGCLGFIGLFVVIGVIGAANAPKTTVTPASSSTSLPAASSSGAPQAKVGDTVRNGNWEYTVTKVEKVKTIKWGDFTGSTTDALGMWLVVSLTLKNVGAQNFPINSFDFQATDAGGIKYDTSTKIETFSFIRYNKLTQLGEQYPPGVAVKTALLFDVSPDAKGLRLVLKQANGATIVLE